MQKKQQFLERIGIELEEKEKAMLLKKKQQLKTEDDYLDEVEKESNDSDGKKKKDLKQIYPVCISYHQDSRILSICLIDCEVKLYQLKL